ncbi:MAG: short-chain fatty acyl-CoA regulator family protein [Myxococcaceae bacterium]|nr:short-chain fatty acyl-CoA regulator family protein [Myxococcaceae bacterium]MCI0672776.1 short-chain fatty acyl-CoA regulator family protein [Myxococcaceae bacterium]
MDGASGAPRLGVKVRSLRRREGLSQAQLATRLGVSPSYLNLIENDRRSLSAAMLLRLAGELGADLRTFTADDDARLAAELLEMFGDPLFEEAGLTSADVRELVAQSPTAARAVLGLYAAYHEARNTARGLEAQLSDAEGVESKPAGVPSEEVSDFLQRHVNHFPALEEAAERLWRDAGLHADELTRGLTQHLERAHGVQVRVAQVEQTRGVLRRYEPERHLLTLSELLPPRSRNFQLAQQVALLSPHADVGRWMADKGLTSDASRTLARVALASYFAGAVLMPYGPFLKAARQARYDIELLGHRFRTSFEQVCHRLTTLRRPGHEGVPFHMVRIDVAGNISKRFSASGIHIARFSGACPRWDVFRAFLTPGRIHTQVSRMPDGKTYFCVARTLSKDGGGYRSQHAVQSLGLGCEVEHARELVYSDGVDLTSPGAAVPVGVTCRLCERTDCTERALPSTRHPLRIDENVRTASFFSPTEP